MHNLWIMFWKKSAFEIFWYVDLWTCSVKYLWYKVFWYRSDLCSQPNYVSVGPANGDYTLVFVDPASGGCALVFVDPASGGCALVFCGPRQWGLNVGHSQGYWVTSVLNRIKFMIILYVNIWKYLISMKYTLIFICSIILEN